MSAEPRHDLRQPERPVHHVKTAPRHQYPGSLADHILQCAQHFMPRDRQMFLRIPQTMICRHIRRIAGHHMIRSSSEDLSCFFDIPCHNMDSVLQAVHAHAAARHVRALLLDLQARKRFPLGPGFQKNRYDPCACPQIQRPFSRLHPCKSGEQHSVHAETETPRILNDPVSVSLQLVHTLSGL